MWKKLDEIENVKHVSSDDKYLLLSDGEKSIVYNIGEFSKSVLQLNEKFIDIFSNQNNIYLKNAKSQLFDIHSDQLFSDLRFKKSYPENNLHFYKMKENGWEIESEIFQNIESNAEIVLPYSTREVVVQDMYVIAERFENGKAITLEKIDKQNHVIWSIDLTKLKPFQGLGNQIKNTEINKILVNGEDMLYLALSNGKYRKYNMDNGEFITEISNLEFQYSDQNPNIFPKSKFSYSSTFDQKIYGLYNYYYWEIDCISDKVEFFIFEQEFIDNDLKNSSAWFYDDNHLYLLNQEHNKIAQFNVQSKTINWQFTFAKKNRITTDFFKVGQFLFIRDSAKILHIFEK